MRLTDLTYMPLSGKSILHFLSLFVLFLGTAAVGYVIAEESIVISEAIEFCESETESEKENELKEDKVKDTLFYSYELNKHIKRHSIMQQHALSFGLVLFYPEVISPPPEHTTSA